jgi:ABC-type antimicrobial peptide transport system permease subunit
VILLQAILIGGAGSVGGLAVVTAIRSLWNSPLAPVDISHSLMAVSVVVVMLICLASALLPFARIRRIDPAIVLMG